MASKKQSIKATFTERGVTSALKGNIPPFTLRDFGKDAVTGLCLVVTEKSKTYYLDKKINGKVYHRKIDDYVNISPANARDMASDLIASLRRDIDPKQVRKAEEAKNDILKITIQQAMDDFIEDSPSLADSTKEGYQAAVKIAFGDIKDKPLFSVTNEQIIKLHLKRSKKSKARADHDMRVFRLLWNWVVDKNKKQYPEILSFHNPVSEAFNTKERRAGTKGWNKPPRKQTIIPRKRLPDWFNALNGLRRKPTQFKNRQSVINFTEFLVLTGLRFNEAATLEWRKVDLVREIIIIEDTTSKNRQELIKPITRRVSEILREQQDKHSDYVFPGDKDHIRDTRAFRELVTTESGIPFTNHDLRRVYLTAGSNAEIPYDKLKILVNHLPRTQGVTEGYIIQSMDVLQEYAQKIEDQILTDAGIKDKSIDTTLMGLLSGMSEDEKRKMIFQLSSELASGGEK